MTILTHLLSKTIIISRLATVSGFKKAYTTTTACSANMQPLSASKTQLIDGVMGKTYVIYADGTIDIQEGDRIRENVTGKLYRVRTGGVSRRTEGSIDYLEVTVEEIS